MTLLRLTGAVAGALLAVIGALAMPAAAQADQLPLGDFGPAPEFAGIETWLNSDPLTIAGLRGKLVLVDFWTYSCINCLRTLPTIVKWYDAYKDKGLVVIGIHTPEFAFEHQTRNVQTALQRFGITYPVAQDNRYGTWQAYGNRSWPAVYLIDRTGRIVLERFGEGRYDEIENAIRRLAAAGPPAARQEGPEQEGPDLSRIGSPEMYLGLLRLDHFGSPENPGRGAQTYSAPASLPLNSLALVGTWTLDDEAATLSAGSGEIVLRFRSGKVHLVAGSPSPITVSVTVDDKPQPPVTIENNRLYTLFDGTDYGEHLLRLKLPSAGFSAFAFTFG